MFLLLVLLYSGLMLWFGYLLSIFKQIETMKSRNKGYVAEIPVVTYCHGGNNIDDMSKFRILLVSFVLNCVLT